MASTPAIACDLSVLTAAQRDRVATLAADTFAAADRGRALPGGYALGFTDASDATVLALAEFIALDRRCCPFLRHAVVSDAGSATTTWLELAGPPAASAAILEDLLALVTPDVAADLRRAPGVDDA